MAKASYEDTKPRANARFRHQWTCPHCAFVHQWTWPSYDRPALGDTTDMVCNNCHLHSPMAWAGPTVGWRPLGAPERTSGS